MTDIPKRPAQATPNNEDGMGLPQGKTCDDCVYFRRCLALIGDVSGNTACDWAPSRFRESAESMRRPLVVENERLRDALHEIVTHVSRQRNPHPGPGKRSAVDEIIDSVTALAQNVLLAEPHLKSAPMTKEDLYQELAVLKQQHQSITTDAGTSHELMKEIRATLRGLHEMLGIVEDAEGSGPAKILKFNAEAHATEQNEDTSPAGPAA